MLLPAHPTDGTPYHRVVIAEFQVGSIHPAERDIPPYDAYCWRTGHATHCGSLAEAERWIVRCAGLATTTEEAA